MDGVSTWRGDASVGNLIILLFKKIGETRPVNAYSLLALRLRTLRTSGFTSIALCPDAYLLVVWLVERKLFEPGLSKVPDCMRYG